MHSGQWWLSWKLSAVYLSGCWSPGDKSFIKVHVFLFSLLNLSHYSWSCARANWQLHRLLAVKIEIFPQQLKWGNFYLFFLFQNVDHHASQSWRMYHVKIITASKNRGVGQWNKGLFCWETVTVLHKHQHLWAEFFLCRNLTLNLNSLCFFLWSTSFISQPLP